MKIDFVLEAGEEITPLKTCQALLEHGEEVKSNPIAVSIGYGPTYFRNTFDTSDLRELANYLLVYCDSKDRREKGIECIETSK